MGSRKEAWSAVSILGHLKHVVRKIFSVCNCTVTQRKDLLRSQWVQQWQSCSLPASSGSACSSHLSHLCESLTHSKGLSALCNLSLHNSHSFAFGRTKGCRLRCSLMPNSALVGIETTQAVPRCSSEGVSCVFFHSQNPGSGEVSSSAGARICFEAWTLYRQCHHVHLYFGGGLQISCPVGMAACWRMDPASPAYNRNYLTLPVGSRRALTEQDALQGEGVRGGISPRWKSFNVK